MVGVLVLLASLGLGVRLQSLVVNHAQIEASQIEACQWADASSFEGFAHYFVAKFLYSQGFRVSENP